ncbi:MAG TPA: ParA family protein [Gammaproteobacteria bacterium]|nr:ParA family protein [Gammaproteobacteria bacterium]
MRKILVLNPKGGCGKSTLATNIAGYFAMQGKRVALADCDPQGSSHDWLKVRPAHLAPIESVDIDKDGLQVNRNTEILVMDSPASLHDQRLVNISRAAETVVIPVLPSPLDIRAAERFLAELVTLKNRIKRKIKIATVANRVREDTIIAAKLEYYLENLRLPDGRKLPFMTVLRASQNYIHAAENGMTLFELPPSKTYYDREQWQPLLSWLNSSRSIPGT